MNLLIYDESVCRKSTATQSLLNIYTLSISANICLTQVVWHWCNQQT